MKVPEGVGPWNEYPSPNQGYDKEQSDLELEACVLGWIHSNSGVMSCLGRNCLRTATTWAIQFKQ